MRNVLLVLLLLGVAAACSPNYPMDKPGTWSLPPNGSGESANDVNLRAMLVNPHDLIAGEGTRITLSSEAAPPVKRLMTGKRSPLPASDVQLNGTGVQTPSPSTQQ